MKVHPRRLCQVEGPDGRWRYVVEAALDAGETVLATYRRDGRPTGCSIARELLRFSAVETVELHDGPELQALVPGVAPVPLARRQVEAEARRRAARRGAAPLPEGGLFDDTARAQQELF